MNNAKYQICTKTVMDTTDPTIKFDQNGISNHYWEFENNIKPKWKIGSDGRFELEKCVEKIKKDGKGKEFDCIMGLSGGADSSYMLHVMVKEFGLRPLVFHVDGGWNSELAVHNINCMIDKLNLDLYTEVINWEEMKDFQLSMFKSGLPNIDGPQDIAFTSVLFKFAQKHKIKYILNGGNISTECVSYPLQYYYYADLSLVNDVLSKFGTIKLSTYPFTSTFYRKIYMPYIHGVKMFKPLNYFNYIKADAMKQLEVEYGWKPYSQKHFESRFTRFFEGYWLPTRFNYDVRRVQFSSLIVTGQMSRDEALELLKSSPYDTELIKQDFEYIATKLNIDKEELKKYHELPKKYYWDYRNQKKYFEFGELILSKLAGIKYGGAY